VVQSFAPISPSPAAPTPPAPLDPALINDAHLLIAIIAVIVVGAIAINIRRWLIETNRDPLCICNDPESHHRAADSGCTDCRCRCFIERPAA
jgi:hypothetical protein